MATNHGQATKDFFCLVQDASLRGGRDENGLWWFSVYDFINFSCGREHGHPYARETFAKLVQDGSEHARELVNDLRSFSFSGKGRSGTPAMTIRGLQCLWMTLSDKAAVKYRRIVEGIFTRYLAGDASLIEEIKENAASDGATRYLCRNALEHEPVESGGSVLGKRKLDQSETEEKRIALEHKKIELREKEMAAEDERYLRPHPAQAVDTAKKILSLFSELDSNCERDEALARQLKDYVQNSVVRANHAAREASEGGE